MTIFHRGIAFIIPLVRISLTVFWRRGFIAYLFPPKSKFAEILPLWNRLRCKLPLSPSSPFTSTRPWRSSSSRNGAMERRPCWAVALCLDTSCITGKWPSWIGCSGRVCRSGWPRAPPRCIGNVSEACWGTTITAGRSRTKACFATTERNAKHVLRVQRTRPSPLASCSTVRRALCLSGGMAFRWGSVSRALRRCPRTYSPRLRPQPRAPRCVSPRAGAPTKTSRIAVVWRCGSGFRPRRLLARFLFHQVCGVTLQRATKRPYRRSWNRRTT